ncbi:hypothetical protein HLK59_10195 [Streptomyces sp. S3(2020)]|nr:hypothetical protein [Streptomyces sp. S3(2020)]NNN30727.1 hypothetical protein [Streptomyces sp. S3(2020)]
MASDVEFSRSQRAYRAYLDHSSGCRTCAVDSTVCTDAERLWNVYQAAPE